MIFVTNRFELMGNLRYPAKNDVVGSQSKSSCIAKNNHTKLPKQDLSGFWIKQWNGFWVKITLDTSKNHYGQTMS